MPVHYHIVTNGDKAGTEIFTIQHASLLLQRVMPGWKKQSKRETRKAVQKRGEVTEDVTKNGLAWRRNGRQNVQNNETYVNIIWENKRRIYSVENKDGDRSLNKDKNKVVMKMWRDEKWKGEEKIGKIQGIQQIEYLIKSERIVPQ